MAHDKIATDGFTPREKRVREAEGPEVEAANLANCGPVMEPNPLIDLAPSEVVIKNSHNASIVVGKDRDGPKTGTKTSYGWRETGCGSVDICVGRMAGTKKGANSNFTVSPNFFTDAARIYVSQKTDVDASFGLVGDAQLVRRSGIGIKADGVRIIGREGVKIVTGKAKNISGAGKGGEKNSQADRIDLVAGIELIAGNDVETEPLEAIVKADALADTLIALCKRIDNLTDIVNENAKIQTQINNTVAKHTHSFAGPGSVLVPPDLAVFVATKEASKMSSVHQNLYKQKMNTKFGFVETRLKQTGAKWFGSRYNKTN